MYSYRSLVRIGDNLYDVKRIFFQTAIKDVNVIKEWLHCTHTFHKDGLLYFCQEIESVEIVEEITELEAWPFITEMKCTVIETIYPEPVTEEETKQLDNE